MWPWIALCGLFSWLDSLGANATLVNMGDTTTPQEIGPSTHALRELLRLRWAEALLSAHEAEGLVMDYVNGQCQLIAKEERGRDLA